MLIFWKSVPISKQSEPVSISFPLYHGGSYDVWNQSTSTYIHTIVHAATSVGSCTQNTTWVYAAIQTCMQNQPLLHMHVLHVASVFIHFFLYNVDLFSCSSVCHVACNFSARNKRSMTNFINACNVSWLLITCTLPLSIH